LPSSQPDRSTPYRSRHADFPFEYRSKFSGPGWRYYRCQRGRRTQQHRPDTRLRQYHLATRQKLRADSRFAIGEIPSATSENPGNVQFPRLVEECVQIAAPPTEEPVAPFCPRSRRTVRRPAFQRQWFVKAIRLTCSAATTRAEGRAKARNERSNAHNRTGGCPITP